ncbi:MAG: alpha/beta hydrolase [Dehalococcoidia bacterium]
MIDDVAPGGVEQAIKDADTFFEIELPALGEWAFGPDQAKAIGQPVLSVVGSDSEAVFVEGRDLLHSWFPQTEDFTLDGAGHLLQAQRPGPLAQALAEFVIRHPVSRVPVTAA